MSKAPTNPIDGASPIIKQYLGYLGTIKGKSAKTVQEYFLDLRTFFRFWKMLKKLVPENTAFEEIAIDDIDLAAIGSVQLSDVYEYMNYLTNVRQNQPAARARKVSSLRTFYKYLSVTTGLLSENPVLQLESPKLKKTLPKYLTFDQSVALLEVPQGVAKERDFCMITLFLNCGLRLSELCGINLSDIRSDQTLRVVGKGNKERTVFLNQACMEALDAYIRVRPKPTADRDALFLSNHKKRISPKTVQYIIKEALKSIGLDTYSTHKLRHTAATLMYQYGHVDIRVLQAILGHENLGTTEIYTHLSNSQMREAAFANPLANISPKLEFSPDDENAMPEHTALPKRKPGRPKKAVDSPTDAPKRKRGRPKKTDTEAE